MLVCNCNPFQVIQLPVIYQMFHLPNMVLQILYITALEGKVST